MQVVDNKQAITSTNVKVLNAHQTLDPEADLVLAIQHQQNQAKWTTKAEWEKSHQDDNTKEENLLDEARFNRDRDLGAKAVRVEG